MKFVVGKQGSNLKKCKEKFNVDSVWFNHSRNVIEIYGDRTNLEQAGSFMERIMQNVKKQKVPPQEQLPSSQLVDDKYIEGTLEGALSKDHVKYLIGKKGYNFKHITKKCNISFIWYDAVKHCICIWGPEQNLHAAVSELYTLINKVKAVHDTTSLDIHMEPVET